MQNTPESKQKHDGKRDFLLFSIKDVKQNETVI